MLISRAYKITLCFTFSGKFYFTRVKQMNTCNKLMNKLFIGLPKGLFNN